MTFRRLSDMVDGRLVGDVEPSCIRTSACEVACRHYQAGDHEEMHVHFVATEITLIASGRARMGGHELGAGDIVILEPGDATDFTALEPTTTVVVTVPSAMRDTYPVDAISDATGWAGPRPAPSAA